MLGIVKGESGGTNRMRILGWCSWWMIMERIVRLMMILDCAMGRISVTITLFKYKAHQILRICVLGKVALVIQLTQLIGWI